MSYHAEPERYETFDYRRCGRSGLLLPPISLGLWHNFGDVDDFENARAMLRAAFDHGITHFDLANNYGPPPGSAERNFGKLFAEDFKPHRDELILSTKAGHRMWDGPYGILGSRKYMLASLDQSLARMGVDYVDIYYSHRPDPDTPMEETMGALDQAVRSGKALYAGISSYSPEQTRKASRILRELGTPCLIHQPSYNLLNRQVEEGLLDVLDDEGIGSIVFCPLAQGILTDKYLKDIPKNSRAANEHSPFLNEDKVSREVAKARALNEIARERGQTLAQMALQWVLRRNTVTSALIGASRVEQIVDNVKALEGGVFRDDELKAIDAACEAGAGCRA